MAFPKEKITFESSNALKIEPANAVLKPDSSIVVAVYQQVPGNVRGKTMVLNNLKAYMASNDLLFSNRVAITLYPNNTKKPDLYHRFPITVSTIFNSLKGLDTLNVFKFKVSGQGFLDKGNEHYLNFEYSISNAVFSDVNIKIEKINGTDNFFNVIIQQYSGTKKIKNKKIISKEEFESIIVKFSEIKMKDIILNQLDILDGTYKKIEIGNYWKDSIVINFHGLDLKNNKELFETIQLLLKIVDVQIIEFQ